MLLLLCLSFLASTSAIQDDYLSKIAAISDFESSEIERLAAYDPDAHLNTVSIIFFKFPFSFIKTHTTAIKFENVRFFNKQTKLKGRSHRNKSVMNKFSN